MWELVWPTRCGGCDRLGAGVLCPACAPSGVLRPPFAIENIQGVATTAGYTSAVGRALRAAKYGKNRVLAARLAMAFAEAVAPILLRSNLHAIVAVPTAWDRLAERGFHPAPLLAAALGRRTGLPVRAGLSMRAGVKQASLSALSRIWNTRARIRSSATFRGNVLLVDDVVTTGATAAACASELLGSGAERVWLATLCATRT